MGFFGSCWPFGQQLYKLDIAELLKKTEQAVTDSNAAVSAAQAAADSSMQAMQLVGQAQTQAQMAQISAQQAAEQSDRSAQAAITAASEARQIANNKLDLPESGTWFPRLANRTTGQNITADTAVIYDPASTGRWYKVGNLVFVDVEIIIASSTVEIYQPAGVLLPFPAVSNLAPLCRGIGYNIVTDYPGGNVAANVDTWAVTGSMAIPYIGQTGAYWNANPGVVSRVCFSGCYLTNVEVATL